MDPPWQRSLSMHAAFAILLSIAIYSSAGHVNSFLRHGSARLSPYNKATIDTGGNHLHCLGGRWPTLTSVHENRMTVFCQGNQPRIKISLRGGGSDDGTDDLGSEQSDGVQTTDDDNPEEKQSSDDQEDEDENDQYGSSTQEDEDEQEQEERSGRGRGREKRDDDSRGTRIKPSAPRRKARAMQRGRGQFNIKDFEEQEAEVEGDDEEDDFDDEGDEPDSFIADETLSKGEAAELAEPPPDIGEVQMGERRRRFQEILERYEPTSESEAPVRVDKKRDRPFTAGMHVCMMMYFFVRGYC
jgi:hypothetical protein